MSRHPVYLEVGTKRTFAGAIDYPGWCRSGRDADSALQALVDYGPRYAAAVRGAVSVTPPSDASDLEVVERLKGGATTDFGAPEASPRGDREPLDGSDVTRQKKLLGACWRAFDTVWHATASVELRKGPRGGGRDHQRMASHVFEAERSYLTQLGARPPKSADGDPMDEMRSLRDAVLHALSARARGEQPDRPSGTRKRWSPRYFVRRAAWHVLDHAWEIEDRAQPH